MKVRYTITIAAIFLFVLLTGPAKADETGSRRDDVPKYTTISFPQTYQKAKRGEILFPSLTGEKGYL
ncbi:MAG: hypothetical protein J7L53_07090 [Deltaproteobacteria bacterium]|nr:hypothetical protein [Deltaproteobacteria bacterium]